MTAPSNTQLVRWLFEAEKPDASLDRAVHALLREHHEKYQHVWPSHRNPPLPADPLPYTLDFEAAMSLIPQESGEVQIWLPRFSFTDNMSFGKVWWVDLNSNIRGAIGDDIYHAHLPIAICIAALEARFSTLVDYGEMKDGDVLFPYRREWTSEVAEN